MTFSIVARDPQTGALGIATATAGPMVGALVPHGRSGLGAVATQAMTNPYLAIDTLALLDAEPAEAALRAALAMDPEAGRRQIIVVDSHGRVAGWTGESCVPHAGHLLGDGVAVAGNMLAGSDVLQAMLETFRGETAHGLAQGLLRALMAGAAAGGDSRGTGSAALKVYGAEAYPDLDLRIDAADDPMAALDRLFTEAHSGGYAAFFAGVPRRHARP
ncbi:DUF1028 domain-containing protein [Devosia aquimaris]|uniref:DUF1028 domain-containing protein n=1 Tax=Devosia aquimaris TaxID=2866214 RepID=UPI001CD0BB4F|nr:DUF1028 domain-containing protein [Devosia sp. CJK-A8-3]